MHSHKTPRIVALAALTALALSAFAIPVAAQGPEDRPGARPFDDDAAPGNRTGPPGLERFREGCHNGTINETACERAAAAHENGTKARRAAHHGLQAIDALEHRIVRLEMQELRIRTALEDGNLTANETADLEARLERIQDAQDEMLLKIQQIQARLEGLQERWQAVRDHVSDHQPVVICHVGSDGEQATLRLPRPAALTHMEHHEDDHRGACDADATATTEESSDESDNDTDEESEGESDEESEEETEDESDEGSEDEDE